MPQSLVLAVYPSVRGFGWIAFEGPFSAYDWGLVFVQSDKNRRCVEHFERLLAHLEPEALVLEAFPEKARRAAASWRCSAPWRPPRLTAASTPRTMGEATCRRCSRRWARARAMTSPSPWPARCRR